MPRHPTVLGGALLLVMLASGASAASLHYGDCPKRPRRHGRPCPPDGPPGQPGAPACAASDLELNDKVNLTSVKPPYSCAPQVCTRPNDTCNPASCCSNPGLPPTPAGEPDRLWSYCLPNLAANCEARDNYACAKCVLWWVASAPDGWCRSPLPSNNLCTSPSATTTIQISNEDANSNSLLHWKAVPNRPIRGLEEISQNDGVASWQDGLWSDVWLALTRSPEALPVGKGPPLSAADVPPGEMGAICNRAFGRTQHQLHIHVGHKRAAFEDSLVSSAAALKVKYLEPGAYTRIAPDGSASGCKPALAFLSTRAVDQLNPFSVYSAAVKSGAWPRELACGKYFNKARYHTSVFVVKAGPKWRCLYAGDTPDKPSRCGRGWIVFLLGGVSDPEVLAYRRR